MFRLRFLQLFETVLILALVLGIIAEIRHFEWPGIVGVVVNLLWQYAILKAIRRQKNLTQMPGVEQFGDMNQQRSLQKIMVIGCFSLVLALLLDAALYIAHIYSPRTFAFFALAAISLAFCYLLISFTRLQKRQAQG